MISSEDSKLPQDLSIPSLVNDITSADQKKQYAGLLGFSKLLSERTVSLINDIINSGAIPPLIQRMQIQSDIKFQIEAASCLADLCSGSREQIQAMVDYEVIPVFLLALKSQTEELEEHGLNGLVYIAQESIKFRDLVLHCDVVEVIVKILQETTNENVKLYGIAALSTLYSGNPPPETALILKGIPLLCHYLQNESNAEMLENVGFALAKISENKEIMDCIIECKIVPHLVKMLSHFDSSVLSACLMLVKNIISGTDEQASLIFQENELIPSLLKLAGHSQTHIRKQVCSLVANITKGPSFQAEIVMGNTDFVEKLIKIGEDENENQDVQKEAIYALVNSTKNCIPAQAIRLLETGVFEFLLWRLQSIHIHDEKLLVEVLDGIGNCLKWGNEFQLLDEYGQNKFLVEIRKLNIVEKIEALQAHKSEKVREKVTQIITDYLSYEG